MKTGCNTTIKTRLITCLLLASFVPAVTVGVVFLACDLTAERNRLIQTLDSLAQGLSFECRAPLAVRDLTKLASNLAGLDAKPHIFAAYIYAKDNDNPVAAYEKPGIRVSRPGIARESNIAFSFLDNRAFAATLGSSEYHFTIDSLSMTVPISNDGYSIGRLRVISDLRDIYGVFHKYAVFGPIAIVFCLLTSLGFAIALIRLICAPIQNLSDSIEHIVSKKDYFKRLRGIGAGELRKISDGFNELLDHVQELDARLESKEAHLKQQCALRASELANSKRCLTQTLIELNRLKEAGAGANGAAPHLPDNGGRAESWSGVGDPEPRVQEDPSAVIGRGA